MMRTLRLSIHIWAVMALSRLSKSAKRRKRESLYLVKTSNPSSGEFQDRVITDDEGKQRPLYEFVGQMVDKWGSDCMGDDYSYVGAVVGATYPEHGKGTCVN